MYIFKLHLSISKFIIYENFNITKEKLNIKYNFISSQKLKSIK